MNEKYDLKLPKSNGYLQNYRRWHQECGNGMICKFDSLNMSSLWSNSPLLIKTNRGQPFRWVNNNNKNKLIYLKEFNDKKKICINKQILFSFFCFKNFYFLFVSHSWIIHNLKNFPLFFFPCLTIFLFKNSNKSFLFY